MTWIKVADGQAVNHNGQLLEGESLLEVEDRLARKWLGRQVVMPAKARQEGDDPPSGVAPSLSDAGSGPQEVRMRSSKDDQRR